jgi:hypothetical protein
MVHEPPVWRYQAEHSLIRGYGHVLLLPHHVLGQWFCVERASGRVLWDHPVAEADSVIGVSEGVIIATQTVERGPGCTTYGVYAISLETGDLLWTSHIAKRDRRGLLETIFSAIGVDTSDYAAGVRGSECISAAGRVLDIHSGKELRREPPAKATDWPALWKMKSRELELYRGDPVDCGSGRLLHRGQPGAPKKKGGGPDGVFALFLSDAQGRTLWSFEISTTGHHTHGNYLAFRLIGGFVYILISDWPKPKPGGPNGPLNARDNPAHFFLCILDIDTGEICQEIRITDEETIHCRIEDLDDHSLLISCGKSVVLFNRMSKPQQ